MKLALRAVGGLFLVGSMLCAVGCSANASDEGPSETTEADLSSAKRARLTARVKALYEDAVKRESEVFFPGEEPINGSQLRGEAHTAYLNFMSNLEAYGFGDPTLKVATVDGFRVYVVGGIVSDTGEEMGFYDSRGKKLCAAYTGQGEQPNANGVDWWE